MVQFKNESVVVELVNNATAILITWIGFIPSPVYRESLDKALDIAQQHKIKNWLSDIRLVRVLSVKDQEWAASDWIIRAINSGCYSKQAVIMPEDIFGFATASNVMTSVQNQQIEIRNFTQVEEAKKWLAQR